MKIAVEDDRLELSGRRGGTVRFADIVVTLGERMRGFADAEQASRVNPKNLSLRLVWGRRKASVVIRAQVWPTRSKRPHQWVESEHF